MDTLHLSVYGVVVLLLVIAALAARILQKLGNAHLLIYDIYGFTKNEHNT